MSASRDAFVRDYLCRGGSSIDNGYLFLSDCRSDNPSVRACHLFKKMSAFLAKNVQITRDGKHYHRPEKITFDFKMGWVLETKSIKCFLGKLSVESELKIRVGHGTYFSGEVCLHGTGMFEVGNFCCIAAGSHFYTSDDGHPLGHLAYINFNTNPRISLLGLDQIAPSYPGIGSTKGLVIGNNVWIARQATIKQGLTLGDGSVIAENAYITKSVAPYSLYGGFPAVLKRKLHSDDTVERLLNLAWWYWTDEQILNNKHLFEKPVSELENDFGAKP